MNGKNQAALRTLVAAGFVLISGAFRLGSVSLSGEAAFPAGLSAAARSDRAGELSLSRAAARALAAANYRAAVLRPPARAPMACVRG